MNSIAFPNMFNDVTTNIVENHEATSSNLYLLLKSARNQLLGDPYFGTNLERLIFEPNSQMIKDLVIDEVYTAILTFMPQIRLTRDKITVTCQDNTAYIKVDALNLLDFQTDVTTIKMTSNEEIL